jgi:CrcB protein
MNVWWLWLMLSGGVGTLARYALASVASRCVLTNFPIGTLVVNLLGCFLFGVAYAVIDRYALGAAYRMVIMTGFLGGFTTFSAYAGETWLLLQAQQYGLALVNVLASNSCSIIGVWSGVALVRLLLK